MSDTSSPSQPSTRFGGLRITARLAEIFIYSLLLFAASVLLGVLWSRVVGPEIRANWSYEPMQATLTGARVEPIYPKEEGDVIDPLSPAQKEIRYRPVVSVTYSHGEKRYALETYNILATLHPDWGLDSEEEGKAAIAPFQERLASGQTTINCWREPTNPQYGAPVVVVVREWSSLPLFLAAGLLGFALINISALSIRLFSLGKSPERQAAIAGRIANSIVATAPTEKMASAAYGETGENPVHDEDAAATFAYGSLAGKKVTPEALANVPQPRTKEAVEALRFPHRLFPATPPGREVIILTFVTILWDGLLGFFIANSLSNWLDNSQPNLLEFLATLPFLLVGIALTIYVGRRLFQAMRLGPTIIEVDQETVEPGQTFRIYIFQSGRVVMRRFNLSLVMIEKTTTRQDSDVRIERRTAFSENLETRENLELKMGRPLEIETEVTIPQNAMHSFEARYNAIVWKLRVQAVVEGRPLVRWEFPVVVRPKRP